MNGHLEDLSVGCKVILQHI